MSEEEVKAAEAKPEAEEEEEEDLEKLQAEIARMEAEAAQMAKENEDMEKKKTDAAAAAPAAAATNDGAAAQAPKRDGCSIYVGQVDYSATPEELLAHFEACGTVERVTIVCDKQTGRPKGYAYLEFQTEDAVENAVKLDGSTFKDRQLKVHPKRVNEPGFHYGAGARGRGRGYRGRGRGGRRGGYRGGYRGGRGGYHPYY